MVKSQIYLFRLVPLFFRLPLFLILIPVLNVFLKFLKKIVIIKPKQNSNPANANNKNDVVTIIKSSFVTPTITAQLYKITQTISEYRIMVSKSELFSKNINNATQNITVIKLIQFKNKYIKIILYLYYNSTTVKLFDTTWSSKKL